MAIRSILAFPGVCALAVCAFAICALAVSARADGPAPSLPTLAVDPQPPPSLWSGLSIGTEMTVSASRHAKSHVGAGVVIGYEHAFANNLVLGVSATTGYAPVSFPHSRFQGYDFTATSVKLGYDMGRVMPYVDVGVALAKPNFGHGFSGASDSFNDMVNGGGRLRALPYVGAGVDYAVTDKLHVGVSVTMSSGAFVPP